MSPRNPQGCLCSVSGQWVGQGSLNHSRSFTCPDRRDSIYLLTSATPRLHSINLWEMAEFLLKQDVVNAINLDGGGSATFVLNGSLASYPSDHW